MSNGGFKLQANYKSSDWADVYTISIWDELNQYIDDDERLVWPEMYLENRHLYDSIRRVVYIVKQRNVPNARAEWVKELDLPHILKNYDVDVVAKQLIVRLRLPWNKVKKEWLCDQEEFESNREYYDVLDIFLKVRRKDNPDEMPTFGDLEFERNRDDYDIVDVRYLVSLKFSAETKARLLGIDPDDVHTYMEK